MPNTRIRYRDWFYPKDVNCFKLSKQWTWQPCLQENLMAMWQWKDWFWPDLLDYSIIKSISKDYYRIESYLELFSDHSSVIFTINSKIITKDKPCTLCKYQNRMALFPQVTENYTWQFHPIKNRQWYYLLS